ncbi:hypothetical protein ACFY1L_38775 [Streptomyces sp. NPDC001663]|uniref:hypothetical protein n=1 Tax=Streptomyces sp. NPDC001663 TaxID=3364597 RepID=UPI0036C1965D
MQGVGDALQQARRIGAGLAQEWVQGAAVGGWRSRLAVPARDLLSRESMDYGYRLLVAGGTNRGHR